MAVYMHCCRAQPLRQLGFLVCHLVIGGPIFKKNLKICPKIVLRCVLSLSYNID